MKEVRFLREREKRRASNVAFVFRPGTDPTRKKQRAMKYTNLAAATVAPAFAGPAVACAPQTAGAPADDSATASSAPNASTTQAAAGKGAAPAATDPGQSAPAAERTLGSITAPGHDVVTQLLVRF